MAKMDDQIVDKRIVERNIQKGLLTRDALEKHLAKLPDAADNAEYVSVDEENDAAPEAEGAEGAEGAASEEE